jgi:protein-L-isoaspartate(D-aspartate) O-methyltransferase
MLEVPRHRFVPFDAVASAYQDHPLPIGHGQTISQPYMVAYMTSLLVPTPVSRVLDIGAGSGYQTAVLCEICQKVYAVEMEEELALAAERRLQEIGYTNFEISSFDASGGWPEHAPYDGIIVAAGAPSIPAPLKEQLADGGRLVIPVGNRGHQQLAVVTRRGSHFDVEWDLLCRFVDLRGACGW